MTGLAALAHPRTWLAISILALLSVTAHWCRDWLAIDSCLDLGHVYDYARETCDHGALTHRAIPYTSRHPTLLRAGMVLGVAGSVLAGLPALLQRTGVTQPTTLLTSSYFSLFMVAATTGLAVWALPGSAKLVLLVPAVLGVAVAALKLRRRAG